jgi:hypothetical protein
MSDPGPGGVRRVSPMRTGNRMPLAVVAAAIAGAVVVALVIWGTPASRNAPSHGSASNPPAVTAAPAPRVPPPAPQETTGQAAPRVP